MIALPLPFAVLDGGLSTALEELGERPMGALWTAQTVLDRPDVVERAHRRAVEAGADIVITASYQASVAGLIAAGLTSGEARSALASTTELARRAGAPIVAASVGPFGACLHDGSEYHGRYGASWDEVRRFHAERLAILLDSGPDLLAIETMPTATEAEIVVEVLRRRSALPAWVSFTCADDRRTAGGDAIDAAAVAVADGVDLVGVNCTAPHLVDALLRRLAGACPGRALVVYPNHARALGEMAGLAPHVADWFTTGARVIGGCCGVDTAEVAAIAAMRRAIVGADDAAR